MKFVKIEFLLFGTHTHTHTHTHTYIYIHIYIYKDKENEEERERERERERGGAFDVMVFIIGNRHSDLSSKPEGSCLHFREY